MLKPVRVISNRVFLPGVGSIATPATSATPTAWFHCDSCAAVFCVAKPRVTFAGDMRPAERPERCPLCAAIGTSDPIPR